MPEMRTPLVYFGKDTEMILGIIIGFIIGTLVGIIVSAFLREAKEGE